MQGVGYRYAACAKARKLHIAGFIMNEPDGSVYIEAEGDDAELNEFLTWCGRGPWTARVERVEATWGEAGGKFIGFRIA